MNHVDFFPQKSILLDLLKRVEPLKLLKACMKETFFWIHLPKTIKSNLVVVALLRVKFYVLKQLKDQLDMTTYANRSQAKSLNFYKRGESKLQP